jgi:hypothetical protein
MGKSIRPSPLIGDRWCRPLRSAGTCPDPTRSDPSASLDRCPCWPRQASVSRHPSATCLLSRCRKLPLHSLGDEERVPSREQAMLIFPPPRRSRAPDYRTEWPAPTLQPHHKEKQLSEPSLSRFHLADSYERSAKRKEERMTDAIPLLPSDSGSARVAQATPHWRGTSFASRPGS